MSATPQTQRPNNPFVEYGYRGPEFFCDREQETAQVEADLRSDSHVAVISPRRIGKSGLIHHVFHHVAASQLDVVCIYIDLMPTRTAAQFAALFTSRVVEAIETLGQSALRRLGQFFGGLRPTLGFDELTGAPQFSVAVEATEQQSTIHRAFQYIAQSGRRCYIALDEFQQVCQYPDGNVEAQLRSEIQQVGNAVFLFAGSEQHIMEEMFLSARRPFYLSSHITHLAPVDEAAYLRFANGFFAQQGRAMPAEAFHRLYTMVDGQTWYVQTLLHRLWEMRGADLGVASVGQAASDVLDRLGVAYANAYAQLTDNQARIVVAVAHGRVVASPLAADFIHRHGLPAASSVSAALRVLLREQVLYHSAAGYMVYDRFYAMWLRREVNA